MANLYNDNRDLKFHLSHPMMQKLVMLKERNFVDKDDFDYAPIDFEDAMDSYERVLEVVGEISGEIIAPNAESIDAINKYILFKFNKCLFYFYLCIYSLKSNLLATFLILKSSLSILNVCLFWGVVGDVGQLKS